MSGVRFFTARPGAVRVSAALAGQVDSSRSLRALRARGLRALHLCQDRGILPVVVITKITIVIVITIITIVIVILILRR